jgi:gluconokinase
MADVVLGLDVGTTSAKATAFDVHGARRGHGEVGYPLHEPHPGWAEQDPDVVADAAVQAVRLAAQQARARGDAVAGLSLSTAMHGLTALDAHDRPLMDILTWGDTRASAQAERLKAEHPQLHGRTGTPLHPMAPLAKLLWLREHEPRTFAAAHRFVGVKELVLHRLTGEWALDHSVASGSGLLDIRRLRWDPEALELAGVDADRLAPLVAAKERFALRDTGAGLEAGTPVIAGAADGPLASLGVGAVRPGVAAVSIGTSGALRVMVENPTTDPDGRVFCYALTPGRWAIGGAINNGGVVLQWAGEALAPDLGEHAERELLTLAAGVPPGSEGLIMLPYLLSERAPHWSALPRGAYVGLTRGHRRAHLIRAAIEGVCQQLALVLVSVREAGNDVVEVRATGGFARSELWRQILTDALGVEVGFPTDHEGSGFGAALLGMEALGLIASIERAAELVTIDERMRPDPEAAAAYAELRPIFASLYDALGPAFAGLRRLDPGSG